MYSYADRMRAVQLYIKLGKRITPAIRQLGYPTKNSLKDWYREYERHHDLPTCYVRRKPRYSPEQKTVAVEHYLSHGRCLTETGKALGARRQLSWPAGVNCLGRWMRGSFLLAHLALRPAGACPGRAARRR